MCVALAAVYPLHSTNAAKGSTMADEVETVSQEKAKGGKLWILIVVLAVIVAGDVVFRALNYFGGPKPAAAAESAADSSKVTEKRSGSESGRKTVGAVVELSPFLVNLADKDSIYYLKATFQLGTALEDEETVKSSVVMPAIRDTIISLLSAKTSDQIMPTEGKSKLREEIRNRINAVLPKGRVQEVYIVDFVVSS